MVGEGEEGRREGPSAEPPVPLPTDQDRERPVCGPDPTTVMKGEEDEGKTPRQRGRGETDGRDD